MIKFLLTALFSLCRIPIFPREAGVLLETAIKGSWFRTQDINEVRGSKMFLQIAEFMERPEEGAGVLFS